MRSLVKCLLIFLLAFAFYGSSVYLPGALNPDGTASVAQAAHKPSHNPPGPGGGGPPGGGPPTVSELPIQYMVSGGLALIVLSGGLVYMVRKRNKEQSGKA